MIILNLDDVIPNWGEGETKEEALNDLFDNIVERHLDLLKNYDKLGDGLKTEVDFMIKLVERLYQP